MTIESLIIWLVIGAIAGWAAGQIMKGYRFGLVGNIVVGIIGALPVGYCHCSESQLAVVSSQQSSTRSSVL